MNNSAYKFFKRRKNVYCLLLVLTEVRTPFAIRDNIKVYFIHIVYTEKMDNTIIVYSINKTARSR